MAWIVRHKNRKVAATGGGERWSSDGVGMNWSKERAELHALRCEYAIKGIPYEIVEAYEIVEVKDDVEPTSGEETGRKRKR